MLKFVPEKYRYLQGKVHIAGSNELLEKNAKLVEVLRPIEMTLDVVLDASKLDRAQISLAIGVLRTALSPFDASTAIPQNLETIVTEPESSRFGNMRPTTPPRGPRHVPNQKDGPRSGPAAHVPRPVFGSSDRRHGGSMRDGKHGAYESASSKKAAKPDAVVVPTFDRLPALAEYQNDRLEEFVEHLAGVLREHKAKTASFVFEMEEQDPLMVGHMVLDRALFVIAARWRLPLQSLGLYWNLSLRQDVEMSGTDATVFVNVDLLNEKDEARIEEEKKRPRSKDRDRSRRKRSRRHERSSRERTHDTADEGTRRILSHGSTQTQKTLTAVDVNATIPWQVDEQNAPVRCEVPGQGCTPSPPTPKSASIAVLSPDDAWSQNMEPENVFEMDGLEPPKSFSSTLPWVPEDEGAAAKHDRSP